MKRIAQSVVPPVEIDVIGKLVKLALEMFSERDGKS